MHTLNAIATAAHTASQTSSSGGGQLTAGLTLMIVGMAVVLAALLVLYAAIRLLDRILREQREQFANATQPAAPPPPTTAASTASNATPSASLNGAPGTREQDRLPPQRIAVLAAAATAALGRPVAVRTAKRVFHLNDDHRAWIAGGRAEIMHSHRPVTRH